MVFSNVIVDITISCSSFVFSRSRTKVSVGLTNVSSLAVVAFYTVLPVCPPVCLLSLTLVIRRRKVVIGLCATRMM